MGNGDYVAFFRGLSIPAFWRVYVQGLVDAIAIVILEVFCQNSTQMSFIEAGSGERRDGLPNTDNVYVTVTTQDILLYNHGNEARTVTTPAGDVEVPGHTIVLVPR